MRCIVLNQDYGYLHITADAFDGIKLVTKGRVQTLASYDKKLRSEKEEFVIPAVVILKGFVRVGRKRHGFTQPSHQNVFVRDKEKCAYCNCKLTLRSTTKDHVIPRAKGGKDVLTNVVACCKACNGLKADRTLADSGMKLRADIELRQLTDDEKLSVLLKTGAGAAERKAWISFLKSSGLSLF
jgi:5-methylcytosine-specific restriction endonuclease McrA